MDSQTYALIQNFYSENFGLVYVTTGGGVALAEWLHAVPGASSTVLDTRIPYSYEARYDLNPDREVQAVSYENVEALLRWAYARAEELLVRQISNRLPVALVCSAALSTDRARRGPNHAWVGIRTPRYARVGHLDLPEPSRAEQEHHLSEALLAKLVLLVAESRAARLTAARAS